MKNVKHIKMLGTGNPELLGNSTCIKNLMDELIIRVGMRPLGETIIYDVPLEIEKLGKEPFEDEGGITAQIVGFATLSTSHCAIHTWPLRKEFHLDLYSCRFFQQGSIVNFLKDFLQIDKMKVSDLTEFCDF